MLIEENIYFWGLIVMTNGESPAQTTRLAINDVIVLFTAQWTPIFVKQFERGSNAVAGPAFFPLQHSG